jgi:hypothetical protein
VLKNVDTVCVGHASEKSSTVTERIICCKAMSFIALVTPPRIFKWRLLFQKTSRSMSGRRTKKKSRGAERGARRGTARPLKRVILTKGDWLGTRCILCLSLRRMVLFRSRESPYGLRY